MAFILQPCCLFFSLLHPNTIPSTHPSQRQHQFNAFRSPITFMMTCCSDSDRILIDFTFFLPASCSSSSCTYSFSATWSDDSLSAFARLSFPIPNKEASVSQTAFLRRCSLAAHSQPCECIQSNPSHFSLRLAEVSFSASQPCSTCSGRWGAHTM